ncbi:GNAT family N-acetyltransferase [Metabacillus arenae]|uniref:GNAT family N-acetyltransferase n=1 Tax=Metabacillus arenae TaxID=2771434 RepID=A0A926NLU5_9BACI|nr:GNAT family N-acetyltransferase [Metabacillus arenae]MBD1380397.1 GNAT family N-acetyltransferase [Metabacillus arenae]
MKKLEDFHVIENNSLLFRPINAEDAPFLFSYFSDLRAMEFYGMAPFKEKKEASLLIEKFAEGFQKGITLRWGICLKDTGQIVGTIGFHLLNHQHHRCEIGYDLHPDYWGQGIGSKAVQTITKYGFKELELYRIGAIVHPDNKRSQGVLLKTVSKKKGI